MRRFRKDILFLALLSVALLLSSCLEEQSEALSSEKTSPQETSEETTGETQANRQRAFTGATVIDGTGAPSQEKAEQSLSAPHYVAAGPLLTAMEVASSVRKGARSIPEQGSKAIKVHRPDLIEDRGQRKALLEAVAEEAQSAGLPVIANVPILESAKDALEAGTSLLIYRLDLECYSRLFPSRLAAILQFWRGR